MAPGPRVFGPNRLGLWCVENANLEDKLKHVLPRARGPLPHLTDIFLPISASRNAKDIVRQHNFFAHLYVVAHNTPPEQLAKDALARRRLIGYGAIEFDLEGEAVQPDRPALADYATALVRQVRKSNPNLPIRLNVPPFKGYGLPIKLIQDDPNLYVIAQAYWGNMDGRNSEADVLLDLLDWGVPRAKAQIHYAVMAGNPRVVCLPGPGYKPLREGSVYDDDLLIAAGLI